MTGRRSIPSFGLASSARWRILSLLAFTALIGPALARSQTPPAAGSAAPAEPPVAEPPAEPPLPAQHVPKVTTELTPKGKLMVGDLAKLVIRADALEGDDVAVPEQSFAPLEVHARRARVEPAKDGRQRFVFELELLALEPGRHAIEGVELRVVTKSGLVGSVRTGSFAIEVGSLLANEPNAQPRPETQPVVVMQDDYTLLYVLGGIALAGLIALVTWLLARYLQRRVKPAPPPPPPRPPWEIAATKLADLRRRKQRMIEDGKAAEFVDEVSDVVREYLGGRFGFDGLETTTDEMLLLLRQGHCNVGLWQEVGAYLRRCDLVKFAKVEPDQDEADLVFAKAQDIVQFSMPLGDGYGQTAPAAATSTSARAEGGAPRAEPGRDEPRQGP
jgi:hypothetical protein